MRYPHLAARIFNTPLMVHPGKLDAIIAGLGPRLLDVSALDNPGIVPEMFSTRRGERSEAGYMVTDGVGVVHAQGVLVHRSRIDFANSTYFLGYNELAGQVEAAMNDPDVHAVAMVFDSPGGEVSGAFELAERLFDMRGRKPMVSVVDSMAASAAYLAASATDEIVTTTTGYTGSIGVVVRHVDLSQALHQDGIKVTHIYAGTHKVDANPYEPLPASVRADIQAEIDTLYTQFVDAVARNRRLESGAVRATEAGVYLGVAGMAVRLADRLSTADAVISELAAQRTRIHPSGAAAPHTIRQNQGASMSGQATAGGQPAAPTTPAPDALAEARAAGHAEGLAAGLEQGTQAERERVTGILSCEHAAANLAQAVQCVNAGLSVEQATTVLAAAPAMATLDTTELAAPFRAAMAAMGNPDVTGIERDTDPGSDAAALAGEIISNFRATA